MLRAVLRGSLLLAVLCAPIVARADEAPALPRHLRETGLYADEAMTRVQPGVVPFSPQYPLWSDGATKHRWIKLPPGTSIDASQADAWEFPRGTKLWKEFSFGARLETRYIELGMDGEWRYGSYAWTADGGDAVLVPAAGIREMAAPSAPGGRYSIPAEDDCRACHEGSTVPVLGFSALQLSPDRDPRAPHADAPVAAVAADAAQPSADLRSLAESGLVRQLSAELLAHPPRIEAANPVERAALGYLHGNCGHCHNDDGPLAVLEMNLAQRVGVKVPTAAVTRALVGVPSQFRIAGGAARVVAGQPAASVVALRMRSREPLKQMPPLGTSAVDTQAMSLVEQWINSLSVH